MKKIALAVAMTPFLSTSLGANAMTYVIDAYATANANRKVIEAKGEIMFHESAIFQEWLRLYNIDVKTVAAIEFDSPGGNVEGAVNFAQNVIEYNGINTSVMPNSTCASACSILWASGVKRSVAPGARVGVHQASIGGTGADELFKHGYDDEAGMTGYHDGRIHYYLDTRGAPASVSSAAFDTMPDGIHWLTPSEIAEWRNIPVQNRPFFHPTR
jgi:hypothetical protein